MEKARLILDAPATGPWNMAMDHAMLETANQTGQVAVRFYWWSQPTLSLGYFQPVKDRICHPPSAHCPVVRRSSGGGAILHDQEITYSICAPSKHRWSSANEDLYSLVHGTIVKLLNDLGVNAEIFADSGRQKNDDFLCFLRRCPGDIVLGDYKIGGSAQRRKRNALLQHGSLLWRRSEHAPELPGIVDLADASDINQRDFVSHWANELANSLGLKMVDSEFSDIEKTQANGIMLTMYGEYDWTNRR